MAKKQGKQTSNQVNKKKAPNPTGKGGFQERPQDRNPGHWKSEDSISFQYNKLLRLSVADFLQWEEQNPEKDRTVAQELAHKAVKKARGDLQYLREVTDRTEGKPPQSLDMTTKGERIETQPVTVMPIKDRSKPKAARKNTKTKSHLKCPHCKFQANAKNGLTNHINYKHSDKK